MSDAPLDDECPAHQFCAVVSSVKTLSHSLHFDSSATDKERMSCINALDDWGYAEGISRDDRILSIMLPQPTNVPFKSILSTWTNSKTNEVTFVARNTHSDVPVRLKDPRTFTLETIVEAASDNCEQTIRFARAVCDTALVKFKDVFLTATACANADTRPFFVEVLRYKSFLSENPPEPFDLVVKSLCHNGKTTTITAYSISTGYSIKNKLADIFDVPVERQRLMCRGVLVYNNVTFAEQNITEASELELMAPCETPHEAPVLGDITVKIVFPNYYTVFATVPRDASVFNVLHYAMCRREEAKLRARGNWLLRGMKRKTEQLS